MSIDLDHLRVIGRLLAGGYAISDKTDVVLKAADLIEAQEAEIDKARTVIGQHAGMRKALANEVARQRAALKGLLNTMPSEATHPAIKAARAALGYRNG